MRKQKPYLQVGDIVTYSRKMPGHLWRVIVAKQKPWDAQDVEYGYCSPTDIGNPHTIEVTLESIFHFSLSKRKRQPRTLSVGTWFLTKVEPQEVAEIIMKLQQFMVDNWP